MCRHCQPRLWCVGCRHSCLTVAQTSQRQHDIAQRSQRMCNDPISHFGPYIPISREPEGNRPRPGMSTFVLILSCITDCQPSNPNTPPTDLDSLEPAKYTFRNEFWALVLYIHGEPFILSHMHNLCEMINSL